MEWNARVWQKSMQAFQEYMTPLAAPMGRSERRIGAMRYVEGLLLPGQRKSIEPMARRLQIESQGLQQFITDSSWQEDAVWKAIHQQVIPHLAPLEAWVVDETGWVKQGNRSAGVAHQYCGSVGKNANCQISVEVGVSEGWVVAPIGGRLYLPQSWAADSGRRLQAGVPPGIEFKTKPEIALELPAAATGSRPADRGAARACPRSPREGRRVAPDLGPETAAERPRGAAVLGDGAASATRGFAGDPALRPAGSIDPATGAQLDRNAYRIGVPPKIRRGSLQIFLDEMEVARAVQPEGPLPESVCLFFVPADFKPACQRSHVGGAVGRAQALIIQAAENTSQIDDGADGRIGHTIDRRFADTVADEPVRDTLEARAFFRDPCRDRIAPIRRRR